jgi:hypothetical protein
MAISGTISQTQFPVRKIVDNAFRRCRLPTQLITSEHLEIASDVLYLLMSELVNEGIPLWAIEKQILPMYEGSTQVECPTGTVDVLNLQIRQLQRLSGTTTSSEGTPDFATDGDVSTSCTQSAAGGNIIIEFASETSITNLGILPNATGTWNIAVQVSPEGITYTTIYSNTTFSAVNGEWTWIDLFDVTTAQQGVSLNEVLFVKLVATAPTVLDVREFVVANSPSEIPMARINRDDYQSLPDKTFQGRPVQYWLDIQRVDPVIRLWPAVQLQYTFFQLILTRKRYLMDVGALTDTLDFPQRWYNAVVCQLSARLAFEIQEVDQSLIPILQGDAQRAMAVAWTGEGDSSPTFFRVNISNYTR